MAIAGVHAIEAGRLVANKTFLRGEGFASLLRPVELIEFPAFAFLIEHPDGLIAIDTGIGAHVPEPRRLRGFPPAPRVTRDEEIGERMRALGLDPGDVSRVVLTHLDWDHTGGLHHFPRAEVLLHRPEHEFAMTRLGAWRYQRDTWPRDFTPAVFDLDDGPFGPFPASRAVTRAGDLRVVPIPGHSPGQVAVVYETADATIFFAADHALRADWLAEDARAERLVMMGAFGKRDARETSRRLIEFLRSRPIVLLPSHDDATPGRLERAEPTLV